jgi:hypothetical protein
MANRLRIPMIMLLLAVSLACFVGCSPKSQQDTGKNTDAVAVDIVVDHDSYFGIANKTVIGDIWFSDSVGMVGTPVDVVVQFGEDYYAKFKDTPIQGVFTLLNTDDVKPGEYDYELTLDERTVEFELYIPQVTTIPSVVNYEILLSATNPDDENEYFEASLTYQFLINQGTPAT